MSEKDRIVIVGGGPAGSVAALSLRKLGRDVALYEKQSFPRYSVGESLLPGTLSILNRLGVLEKVEAAKFVEKRAATFLWGAERRPWSFTFATPGNVQGVFDHAYQVTRSEFDQILLDAARDEGAVVNEQHEVSEVDLSSDQGPAKVHWKNCENQGVDQADFVIDASGSRGVIAKKLKLRRYDTYFRNVAMWSYFKGGKRFKGGLEGNVFTVAVPEGWIWAIPLKGDLYSVGVVTGKESSSSIRELGVEGFFDKCWQTVPLLQEILETAERTDKVRTTGEWAYSASEFSLDRAFLCGDSACFIDPLFSQGVHLAVYSGMLAAACIDRILERPEEAEEIHHWYGRSYREIYQRYHLFLSAFYSCNADLGSEFWEKRKIAGAEDARFAGSTWFETMTGEQIQAGGEGVEELEERAAKLADLWQHDTTELGDQSDDMGLSLRRIKAANDSLKAYKRMAAIEWIGDEVRLVPSFKVHPETFKLERQCFIGDESGNTMSAFPLQEEHRELFARLKEEPLSYRELTRELKRLGSQGTPLQLVGRLMEGGFLRGFDKNGERIHVKPPLQFAGVGAEDQFS